MAQHTTPPDQFQRFRATRTTCKWKGLEGVCCNDSQQNGYPTWHSAPHPQTNSRMCDSYRLGRRQVLAQEGASCNDSQQSRSVQGLFNTAAAVEHVWFVPSHYLCETTLNAPLHMSTGLVITCARPRSMPNYSRSLPHKTQ